MIIKQYANSGVDGASGYEFQKHCALYIFLEQYEEIKDNNSKLYNLKNNNISNKIKWLINSNSNIKIKLLKSKFIILPST